MLTCVREAYSYKLWLGLLGRTSWSKVTGDVGKSVEGKACLSVVEQKGASKVSKFKQ